jgi:hypothetical protein
MNKDFAIELDSLSSIDEIKKRRKKRERAG